MLKGKSKKESNTLLNERRMDRVIGASKLGCSPVSYYKAGSVVGVIRSSGGHGKKAPGSSIL